MTTSNRSDRVRLAVPLPWLTVETTLWGLLLITALGLRLWRLDAAPLNASEARGALAVWRFLEGGGTATDVTYSPLLFSGQWFTFLLSGASDFGARLLPALSGTALALTPALLRRRLGRIGALLAGALLALSPTAVTLARTATGDVIVALGAVLFVAGLWRYLETAADPAALLSATGVALMLVSSPLAYSALIALGVALALLYFGDLQSKAHLHAGWTTLRNTPNLVTYAVGTLVGGVVLLSTALGWHIPGLGATGGLLTEWLGGFVRWPDSPSWDYPLRLLIFYEPLVLLAGSAGIVLAIRDALNRGRAVSRLFSVWSAAALILALLRPGHGPGDVLLVLVPLAGLGGLALDRLVADLRRVGSWLNEGPYLAISLPLAAYLAINLTIYANRPGQYTQVDLLLIKFSLPTYLSLTLVSVVLLLVMAAVLSMVQGRGPTLRALALAGGLVLLLYTVATTWGTTQNRPADPREMLALEPTAQEVRLLRESLVDLSHRRGKGAHGIDVTLLTDDPALVWTLRDFRQTRMADATERALLDPVVIAPHSLGTPSLGGGYLGQVFPLRRRWEPQNLTCRWTTPQLSFEPVRRLDCQALVEWLVFRRSPEQPAKERIVLWVRQDLVGQPTNQQID